jgi:hypothetical protein
MVYNTQNYQVFRICPLSGNTFWKPDLFLSLGPSERATLNYRGFPVSKGLNTVAVSPTDLKMETDPVSETSGLLVPRILDNGQGLKTQ